MVTKKATVTWLTGLTFDADMGGRHLMIDASGEYGDGRGPTPMELLLSALAGCTAMDVVGILKKSRQPFTGLAVHVEGEKASDHPHRFTHLSLVFEVHGDGVDLQAVERAVDLSAKRYCSVQATLLQAPEITTRIEMAGTGE